MSRPHLVLMLATASVVAATAVTPPADWGEDIATFNINNTYFGTTKAAVTNGNSQYTVMPAPESPLDVVSYRILAVPDERLKIGAIRPGVIVEILKNVYFNKAGEVVAIEMVFTNLDVDKRRYLFEALDRKYEGVPDERRNFWKYKVSANIQLETTVAETAPQQVVGGKVMSASYRVSNLYMHKTRYRAALDEARSSNPLYNLL